MSSSRDLRLALRHNSNSSKPIKKNFPFRQPNPIASRVIANFSCVFLQLYHSKANTSLPCQIDATTTDKRNNQVLKTLLSWMYANISVWSSLSFTPLAVEKRHSDDTLVEIADSVFRLSHSQRKRSYAFDCQHKAKYFSNAVLSDCWVVVRYCSVLSLLPSSWCYKDIIKNKAFTR